MKKLFKKALDIFMAIGDSVSGFRYAEEECDWCGDTEQGYMMIGANCPKCTGAFMARNEKMLNERADKFREKAPYSEDFPQPNSFSERLEL